MYHWLSDYSLGPESLLLFVQFEPRRSSSSGGSASFAASFLLRPNPSLWHLLVEALTKSGWRLTSWRIQVADSVYLETSGSVGGVVGVDGATRFTTKQRELYS